MSTSSIITIGADPEYVIAKPNGTFVKANIVNNHSSDCGCDGNDSVAEIRPHFCYRAIELVATIQKLFMDALAQNPLIDGLHFLAGHFKHGRAIGGHIHVASNKTLNPDYLGPYLQVWLGYLSDTIDNLDERSRRANSGYGLGGPAWRKDHGYNWIEYRVPGSWLISPEVAFMNLYLAEAVSTAYLLGNKTALKAESVANKPEAIMKFVAQVDLPDRDLFSLVASKVFSSKVNWDVDFKQNWRLN